MNCETQRGAGRGGVRGPLALLSRKLRPCRSLAIALGVLFSLSPAAWGGSCAEKEVSADLVDIARVVPSVVVDLRYATADNFTGKVVYGCNRCFLAATTAKKLAAAQAELQKLGLGLKVWDCYRPLSVQRTFWALVPDERYVADPRKGSRHNRGASVDVTLVAADGKELPMPTAFDDFTTRASQDFRDLPAQLLENRAILVRAMKSTGFHPLATEWWHYDDVDWSNYRLLDLPFEDLCRQ
ncbi:M15 family metallopeptidase [Geomonas sp.]|uniref:M15 family metallopeptidase n=1 Tax=Geomonas sp. TaxID=2651584 RepID=UPI002B45FCDE|nr:M15 family metallopeptidase [Geomonas sp.]HJV34735.1 M15 family metallopeptidase [Geomonas sp.]